MGFQQTRLDHLASLRIYASIDRVMAALVARLALQVPPPCSVPAPSSSTPPPPPSAHPLAEGVSEGGEGGLPPLVVEDAPPTTPTPLPVAVSPSELFADRFEIRGYNAVTGRRLESGGSGSGGDGDGSGADRVVLDLSVGSRVVIPQGSRAGAVGEVVGRTKDGNYKILFQVPLPSPPPPPAAHSRASTSTSTSTSPSATGAGPKRMSTAPLNMMLGRWMVDGAVAGELDYLAVLNC